MRAIDLNADLGEGALAEDQIIPWISSANIACGGHAGDEGTMRATLELAARHGVHPGAHPGFADREHFGRRELPVTPADVFQLVRAQTNRLRIAAESFGARLSHVKPHGALYNMASRQAALAAAVAEAVRTVDPGLRLFGLAGSELVRAGSAAGLSVVSEVFADRTYQADGSLTPRNRPDAQIHSVETAVQQVLRMVFEGKVRSTDGRDMNVEAHTVCIHGDGPHAVAFTQELRRRLESAGVQIRAPSP